MSISKLFRPKTLAVSILILILAVAAFGYAAANVVSPSGAGDGTGVVSGYTILNISYELNGTNPAVIDSVTFTVNPTGVAPPAYNVRISLDNVTWSPLCDRSSAPVFTCTFIMNVVDIENLRVVATS